METKICAQCGQEKPIEDFSKSYKCFCKSCVAENQRKKRMEAKEMFSSARGLNVVDSEPQFIPHPRFIASVAAMQGILANTELSAALCNQANKANNMDRFYQGVADGAVKLADALINELNKPKDEDNK